MSKNIAMTDGNVREKLIKLATPMIFGMLGLIIFNLVDTFFVSMLGTNELAALSFTYPVVLILNSLSLGIGMGSTSLVSQAIGKKNHDEITRLATDSLSLGLFIVFIFIVIGLNTIEPVFRLLGANDVVMPIIVSYMRIWFLGTIFVVIPMIGNSTIRALGDTRTPSMIMIIAAVVNTILDPILIFGLGPFPRLEVPGAAIATVLSRMITFTVALYVLGKREKILSFKKISFRRMIQSWKKILYIGAPNAFIRMIQPIGVGIITGFLANISIEAVAGFGIAAKVERFAIIIIGSLAVIMLPFIGQNFGAKKFDRIKLSIKESFKIMLITSFLVYCMLFILSKPIALLFSDDEQVVKVFTVYIRMVALFYSAYGMMQIGNSFFNAINQPIKATMITFTQMFIIFVPLAYIGSLLWGYYGIFIALAVSYILAGLIAFTMMNQKIKEWDK